jgi:hypothetical protein
MPIRFNRRFRIVPGVRLNVGKNGLSVSVGQRGGWLTFGPRGAKASLGVPGTGVEWTSSNRPVNGWSPWWWAVLIDGFLMLATCAGGHG